MKLYYYNEHFNFGDALNPWLWSKLIPEILDRDDRIAFIGIGTLLNEWLPYRTPSAQQRVIFSTGVGYGNGLPQLSLTDRIYCLRGPLSARALGFDPKLAVTDGAVLLRRCFEPLTQKLYRFAYMPHWQNADCDWQLVCQELGWDYIDPRWSIPKILAAISQTEVLLAEAMHGAIIADALRVPWIPIVTNTGVLTFKWHDWCQSVDLDYKPVLLQPPITFSPLTDAFDRASLGDDWISQKQAIYQFRQIANTVNPQLSADRKIEDLTCELEARLAQFQTDVQRGDFLPTASSIDELVDPPTLESTQIKDLTQFYLHCEPQKIELLQQGISVNFTPASASEITKFRSNYQIVVPYLLLIGELDCHFIATYPALITLFDSNQIELIYIGKQPLANLTQSYPQLRLLNLTSQSHLIAAYSGAIAVIDLTNPNGFDWCIIEAMACGCPVISDQNSICSSVARSAILSPKYTDRDAVNHALIQIQDPKQRQSLVRSSLEFSQHFSMEAVAQIITNQLLDITTEMQAGGLSPSDSLSWYQQRLLQRSIARATNEANECNRSTLELELTTIQQQLGDAQQQLTTAQQQLSDAQIQIRSMEQTKIWQARQAWHRIKSRVK